MRSDMNRIDHTKPEFLYDVDSPLCCYWVRYWKRLTKDHILYSGHSGAVENRCQTTFAEKGMLFTWYGRDGGVSLDAGAIFSLLDEGCGQKGGLWFYTRVAIFAWICDAVFGVIARYPKVCFRLSRLLWGVERYAEKSILVSWLFIRLLATVYLFAFYSMSLQIEGLVGSNGILPFADLLDRLYKESGTTAFWRIPTIFWFDASDKMLTGVCIAGVVFSIFAMLNILAPFALAANFILYLSLTYAGLDFTSFQWDMFLLESGFLAIFLSSGWPFLVFLYRWLLFRFMFLAGLVKVASGDPGWANLTALTYHFETQPLPTCLAWYAHQLPLGVLKFSVFSVLVIELVVPFLVFLPRKPRLFAAWCFLLLQISIILTGNYNFFNLLTVFMCLFLFDDRDIRGLLGDRLSLRIERGFPVPGPSADIASGFLAASILGSCALLAWTATPNKQPPFPLSVLSDVTSRLGIVNAYGPFAIMTTRRTEIVIEGSWDGEQWIPYPFKYKPGALDTPLSWIIPHQPRLDWQMWFAALQPTRPPFWFHRLMIQLKTGSVEVLDLFAETPFSERPPSYLRASYYVYEFATPEKKRERGHNWQRRYLGSYWPR